MQKVKILKNYRAALNVTQTVVYKAGEIYEVDDQMCKNMFHDGVAELVEEKAKPAPEENKAVKKAPENKAKSKKKK